MRKISRILGFIFWILSLVLFGGLLVWMNVIGDKSSLYQSLGLAMLVDIGIGCLAFFVIIISFANSTNSLHEVAKSNVTYLPVARFGKWFFGLLWILSLGTFVYGLNFAPSNYASQANNPWGNLIGTSLVTWIVSFSLMLICYLRDAEYLQSKRIIGKNVIKKSMYSTITVGYVLFTLFIAFVLSAIVGVISLPFMQIADGYSYTEKAAIGGRNMWRFVSIYTLFTIIITAVTFVAKRWRLLGVTFVAFSILGISFVAYLDKENSVVTDGDSDVVTDTTKCEENKSINSTKMCTVLVIRDDGGHGTGFSIKKGYIITNKHVIEGAKKLTTYIDGEKDLTMWNYSPTLDVAILKLSVDIPTCKWFNSSGLSLAESLFAVGWPNNPAGDSTITKGIFSRLNTYDGGLEFVQTDAAINPGNSGGPLVNSCGVVGINTQKEFWTQEQLPRPLEGLGNAMSSKLLIPLINELIAQGKETAIPKSSITYKKSNPSGPISTPSLDVDNIRNYLSRLHELKDSWSVNNGRYPRSDSEALLDSFTRQISFCETLLDRLNGGKSASQDDIFMWDSIVKMSYETAAITSRLNKY